VLTIDHVCKTFGTHTVLRDVCLQIDRGCVLGLAGPSGEGKSTLLRCIQGLETVDSGSITCAGRVGFMFQDFQLFPHMSVLENVLYAPLLRAKGKIAQKTCMEKGEELLKHLDMWGLRNRYPQQLSGGQKQRVALARSLVLNPDLLLCDEPTSGLDVAMLSDVVALLHSLREEHTTMAIASHDLSFLVQISDRIIILRRGCIAADIGPERFGDLPQLASSLFG
jgi:polar amino acid transport system ATP-binding protein